MLPSVRVGWAPDVTARDTAALQTFHKVGLDSWEPYRTQPTKQALLSANFILLLSNKEFWVSRSSKSKHQHKSTFFVCFFCCCYTQLNTLIVVTFCSRLLTKTYPRINTWKPGPKHFQFIMLNYEQFKKSPQGWFSALWLTGGNFKSKQLFPFGLSLAGRLGGVKEYKEVSHSYQTALRESRHWAHNICSQSSSTTIQTAEPKTRIPA